MQDGFARRFAFRLGYYGPSVLAIAILVVLWQVGVVLWGVKAYILPTPMQAVATLYDPKYRWFANALITLYAIAGGFLISSVLGIMLAVAVVWNSLLERTLMPLLVLFNTLPKVALAPLFVVWLGYGVVPNMVIATTVSFFVVVVNTAVGLQNVEPELLDLVATLRAGKWTVFRKIRFPSALPYIFAGLKLNATTSVVGVIVGEFVASEHGLGALIITSGTTIDTPAIFAALMLISLIGLACYGLVALAERLAMPWEFRANEDS
jgi:NitT/TauT family transport system permease protein